MAALAAVLALAPAASANVAPVCNGMSYSETHVDVQVYATASCSDADAGTRLTYTVVDSPAHGTVSPGWSYGIFVYKPAAGYIGDDTFSLRANDGTADSSGLFEVEVGVKAPMVPSSCPTYPSSWTFPVRTNTPTVAPLGWVFCTPVSGMPFSVDIVTPPAHGMLSGPPESPIYSPAAGYEGTDQITYRVRNAAGQATQLLTWPIQVSASPDWAPQLCAGGPSHVRAGASVTIALRCSDQDVEPVAITIGTPPQHGTLSAVVADPYLPAAGTLQPQLSYSYAHVTYTPDSGYTGTDSFTIVGDDGRQTVVGSQSIMVDAAGSNAPPTCSANSTTVTDGSSVTVPAFCSDPDGDPVTVSTVLVPAQGTIGPWAPVTGYPFGATYTPSAGFVGADLIAIQATDSKGATSAVTTMPITIVGAGFRVTAPNWGACGVRMLMVKRNQTVTIPELKCSAIDGAPITATLTGSPAHGTATLTGAGALQFVPERNYVGGDTLSLHLESAGRSTTLAIPVVITPQAKTRILAGPAASSTSHAPSFTLYAEGSATLTCALSGSSQATPAPCSGTQSYSGVSTGDHTLTVTATDAQNRTSADTYVFTVTDPSTGGGNGGGSGGGGGGGGSSSGSSAATGASTTPTADSGAGSAPAPTPAASTTPTPATPTPPAAKTPSPRVALAQGLTGSPKRTTVLKRGASLSFTAPAAGTLGVRWYVTVPGRKGHGSRLVLIATGSRKATAAGVDVSVTLTLTTAGRRLLAAATGPVKVRAVATFTPRSGAKTVVTRTLTLG
jgi:uncharacterized membrane protein YgcG